MFDLLIRVCNMSEGMREVRREIHDASYGGKSLPMSGPPNHQEPHLSTTNHWEDWTWLLVRRLASLQYSVVFIFHKIRRWVASAEKVPLGEMEKVGIGGGIK